MTLKVSSYFNDRYTVIISLVNYYSISETNCTGALIDSGSSPTSGTTTMVTTNLSSYCGPMVSQAVQDLDNSQTTTFEQITSQPSQVQSPENTGLIAAVISVIIVLLGIMIVLAVVVLLMKKRYNSNVMRELYFLTLLHFILSCIENGKEQISVHMK